MIHWLNDNSGAVQGIAVPVLVLVTAFYVWFTWQMVREMQKQRLAEDRPHLLVDVANAEALEWHEPKGEGEEERAKSRQDPYPETLVCRIHNVGRQAAKEIEVTVLYPGVSFERRTKGFLLPGDTWEVGVSAAPLWLELVQKPAGLREWSAAHGVSMPVRRLSVPVPGWGETAAVASYRDIHNVHWATCLVCSILHGKTSGGAPDHTMYFLGQHLVRLKKEGGTWLHMKG